MKQALILVSSYFPRGIAISSRMLNFCRLIRDAGYSVHVITGHAADQEVVPLKVYSIEDITYQVISSSSGSSKESFLGNPRFIKECERYLEANNVEFVFMTASSEMFIRLQRVIRAHHVRHYIEQCEWMDVSTYKLRYADIRYHKAEMLCKLGYFHPDGIVSISRLLNDHYKALGVNSIRIPTILDVKNTSCLSQFKRSDKIHIVFAGSLGGSKEWMKPIIEALASSEKYRKIVIFDVYGPSREQIVTNIGGSQKLLDKAGESVVIHGRIPQEEIPEVYAHSDYLIFVRPQRRSSDAGFPTKFAESMAVGTPVITNNTGDVGLYLRDGENGYLLTNNTTEAVCECFEKMINLDADQYMQMRNMARKTAEESFDYRVYIDQVSSFFGK